MLTMYHRTTLEAADEFLKDGFRDGVGSYMTRNTYSGIWITDTEEDPSQGCLGDALLVITLGLEEDALAPYEWVEEGKGYREWLVPASLLNENMSLELIDESDPNNW